MILYLQEKFAHSHLHCSNKKEDIGDDAHLKYVQQYFVFANRALDSSNQTSLSNNGLAGDQVKSLKNELNNFSNFIREYKKDQPAGNLTLIPIRLSNDTSVYKRLTGFQKENTFVLYDNRFPDSTLGYVLFFSRLKNINDRIWSWTLLFKFGKYMFKSVAGEEGYEYIFSPKK